MPETRFIEHYKGGTDKPVLLSREPYEVSDEELQVEKDNETIAKLSAPNRKLTASETAELVQALARQRR